jgi:DNA-binding XRE family transcriptional regulator
MPNIATLLKGEILRLSRRAARAEIEATARASAQQRKYIATLRREVATLKRDLAHLRRRMGRDSTIEPKAAEGTRLRFVAKGFRSQRNRLGLSAAECGKLLGVSAQSIYNWEHQVSTPRPEQLRRIAGLRGLGKREARSRLAQLEGR